MREWSDYRRAYSEGGSPVDAEEELTPTDARLEELWLGLRTDRGVGTGGWRVEATDLMTSWVSQGYATHENERLRLTPVGWLLLDHLVVKLERALGPLGATG